MRILCMDCEGPITLNDNAFELCAHFLPQGEAFFSLVSMYDDYCTDAYVENGYRPGTTLAFIVPFLKAHGLDNQRIKTFSRETLAFVPGALDMIRNAQEMLPLYVISTSYRAYIEAMAEASCLPLEHTFSTSVDFAFTMEQEECNRVLALYEELTTMRLEHLSQRNTSELREEPTIKRLDEIFFQELPRMQCGSSIKRTLPVGGTQKKRAIQQIAVKHGVPHREIMYTGDSITDTSALRFLHREGGCSISFNGNAHAVRAAEFAYISSEASMLIPIIKSFVSGGTTEVRHLASTWLSHMDKPDSTTLPQHNAIFTRVNQTNMEMILRLSQQRRCELRGTKRGKLG